MNSDNEEPEIVVIAQKEVVIRTDQKQSDKHNNNKTKKHASTSNQKTMNDTADVFKMMLTTNGVVDLGD